MERQDEEVAGPSVPLVNPNELQSTANPLSSDNESISNLGSLLFEQRKTGFCCDVKLEVEGVEIFAHKAVLIAKCPFFAGMFSSGLVETNAEVIRLQHVTLTSIESLLAYLYIDKYEITIDSVWELIHIANMYQVSSLFDRCVNFLCESISMDNYSDIAEVATQLESDKMRSAVADHIASNWEEMKESREFFALDEHIFEQIISSKDIRGYNEEAIATYILDWTTHEPNRIHYFKKLSRNIRFKSLRRDFILNQFVKHPIFFARHDLLEFVFDRMLQDREEINLSDDDSILLEFGAEGEGSGLAPGYTGPLGDSQTFPGCGYVGRIDLRVAEKHGDEVRFRIEGNFRFVTGVPCRDVLFVVAINSLNGSTAVIQKRFTHNLTETVETPVLKVNMSRFKVLIRVFVH